MTATNRYTESVISQAQDERAEQGPELRLKPGQSLKSKKDVADEIQQLVNNVFSKGFKPF